MNLWFRFVLGSLATHVFVFPLATFGASTDADVVMLPPFVVEDATLDPPWRYTLINRFEILSCCPDRVTSELAETVLRAYALFHVVVPERFCGRSEVPDALIFFDEYYWPVASREAIATRLRSGLQLDLPHEGVPSAGREAPPLEGAPRRVVKVDPLTMGGDLYWEAPPIGRTADFFSHLQLADMDSMTTFILVSRSNLDLDGWHLSPGSVRELLERRVPGLPSWFVVGFLGLYRELKFDGGAMTAPPAVWLSDEETRKVLRDPANAWPVLPMADLFAEPAPSAGGEAHLRLAQAELFVRWALEPGQSARSEAFWQLVERACSEPVNEAMVVECFGLSCAELTTRLAEFLPLAVRRSSTWRAPAMAAHPSLYVREASPSEVARIKGNWERLEARYVRRQLPVLESKYYELARRTLERADDGGDRDPAVLAVRGLLEHDAGNSGAAQEFLTRAVDHGIVRPQAGFELAALLFRERRDLSRLPERALERREAGAVLELLERVRRQAPALLEVYVLIATVWTNCVDAPRPGDLAVLDEGVALFPRQAGLILQVASLHAAHGSLERASALVDVGLRHAVDEDVREQLLNLRAMLASKPSTSPPAYAEPPGT